MSVQVNIRVEEQLADELQGWAVLRNVSRADLVRGVIEDWVRQQRREQIEAEYRAAYTEFPETEEEMAEAEENGRQMVEEEPWEKWW